MALLSYNVALPRVHHAGSFYYHYECLTSRNAYDYMHNCYTTKFVPKASGGSFSTVFAKRGYTAPRCQSTLKIIYSLSSAEA